MQTVGLHYILYPKSNDFMQPSHLQCYRKEEEKIKCHPNLFFLLLVSSWVMLHIFHFQRIGPWPILS